MHDLHAGLLLLTEVLHFRSLVLDERQVHLTCELLWYMLLDLLELEFSKEEIAAEKQRDLGSGYHVFMAGSKLVGGRRWNLALNRRVLYQTLVGVVLNTVALPLWKALRALYWRKLHLQNTLEEASFDSFADVSIKKVIFFTQSVSITVSIGSRPPV